MRSRIRSASMKGRPKRSRSPSSHVSPRTFRARRWHASQRNADQDNGGVVVTLDVCNDWALRSWILGFGPLAQVLSPASLAHQIRDEIEQARSRYAALE